MMSAAASLGLSLLWDTDVGLGHVDKYTYSAEEYIKVSEGFREMTAFVHQTLGWRTACHRYSKHERSD
jgi:hypothetical protein